MDLKINNLNEVIVKVNNGTGIILKLETERKCYVLTAYHNVKDSIKNKEFIRLFSDKDIPCSQIGEPIVYTDSDFALLEIDYISQKIPIVNFEKNINPDDEITFIGYPDKANKDRKRLNGRVIEWNDKTAVNVTEENIQGSFIEKEKTNEVLIGFSGSGVLKKNAENLTLIGILKSLPEENFDYKEISCVPIDLILSSIPTKRMLLNEVNLDSINILKKVILGKRDFKNLSENEGEKSSKELIHYEYFHYTDGNIEKGYIFLGKNITNKNVFKNIKEKMTKDKIKVLDIFLLKAFSLNGHLIDKKKDITKNLKEFGLVRIVNNNIHYIDDFIWENTIENDLDTDITHTREDFVDQMIYNENTEKIELSLNILKNDIKYEDNPISVIYGSGGVGKTTLCNALEDNINIDAKIRKKVFYIKGEKIVDILAERNQSSLEIKTLNDLYTLYKGENNFSDFDNELFRLNYISGNIIVIIDAIEEIESALGDKFVLKSFLQSLKKLNENYFCTKIIITTREPFYIKIKDKDKDIGLNIQYFKLLGFTSEDLQSFLIKRYDNDNDRNKVKACIDENSLFDQVSGGHIIPLFVDWVCKIIDRPNSNRSTETKYFLKNITIDKLLIKLINREIVKQSLSLNLDEMFKFLEEIIIEHNGIISKNDFKEYIEIEIGDKKIDNYIKNPLFNTDDESIKIKYDILLDFIKARSLRYKLINNQTTVVKLLKTCFDGKNELSRSFVKIFTHDNTLSKFQYQIKHLIELIKKDEFENSREKEDIKKSISALLYLSTELLIQKKEKTEYSSLLKKLYNNDTHISYLFIYGDFYPLDFTGLTIRESEFIKFINFQKCIFAENTSFSYSHFKDINISKSDSITSKLFDYCQYTNSNIEEMTKEVDDKKSNKEVELYKDISAICKKIGESQKLQKVFENEKTIKSNIKTKKFLSTLVDVELLVEKNFKNEIMYRVNQKYYDELPDMKLGDFPPELRERINEAFN